MHTLAWFRVSYFVSVSNVVFLCLCSALGLDFGVCGWQDEETPWVCMHRIALFRPGLIDFGVDGWQDEEPGSEEMQSISLFRPHFVEGFPNDYKPYVVANERGKGLCVCERECVGVCGRLRWVWTRI